MDSGDGLPVGELEVSPHQEVEHGAGLVSGAGQRTITAAQQVIAQAPAQLRRTWIYGEKHWLVR